MHISPVACFIACPDSCYIGLIKPALTVKITFADTRVNPMHQVDL
jgi:hypothetical protein